MLGWALAAETNNSKELEISGWIPYWTIVAGAKDAENHLDTLDTLHPFGYSVKADGTLNDLAKVSKNATDKTAKTAWQNLFKLARKKDVDILPTVMWSQGADIERILSDKTLRKKHIKAIMDMVKKEKFDGVNIDYEAKLAETKSDFATFLKELKKELGKNKILSCAIEARTPPDSLYRVVPTDIQYANDFKAIGKHCDEVEIMAYDQGRADIKLNDAKAGSPYIPVADKDWVRKVAELAMKDIPKKKIMLGVATYGQEYIVTVSPNRFKDYKKVQSLNHVYATDVAATYDITPLRDKAGELSFSYLPVNGTAERNALIAALPGLTVPAGTSEGDMIAQKALAYANKTGQTTTFNFIRWSDSKAIEDKVKLAQELGLKGVAIFKIDGEEDPAVWNVLSK
ncbi:MAG: glycosyl hydrolase family 18 protein [Minisyncoccia bacterium]